MKDLNVLYYKYRSKCWYLFLKTALEAVGDENRPKFSQGAGRALTRKKHRRSVRTAAWLTALAKQNIIVATFLWHSASEYLRKNKFSKNDFHTLQGTMSHRPLTNTLILKITAAYCPTTLHVMDLGHPTPLASHHCWGLNLPGLLRVGSTSLVSFEGGGDKSIPSLRQAPPPRPPPKLIVSL